MSDPNPKRGRSDSGGRGRGRGDQRGGHGHSRHGGGQRRDDRPSASGYQQRGGSGDSGRDRSDQSGGHSGGYGHSRQGGGQRRDDRPSTSSYQQRGESGDSGRGGSYQGRRDQWRGDGGGDRSHRGGGGGGGRGRGRGRPESPVRNDVREIARTVCEPTHKGSKGEKVELITNHYPIEAKDLSVCHYDIQIVLRRRDGKESTQREQKNVRNEKAIENKQLIDKMAVEWVQERPDFPLQPNSYAYDGNKILFTSDNLRIGEQEVTRTVIITLDGFPEQTYDVKIKFARNVSLTDLSTSEEFEDSRQALDIIFRHRMLRQGGPLVGVGRNLFSRDAQNTKELRGNNCSIGFGHHQSIQKTESGLTVNVDRVSTIFRGDGRLDDFIRREKNWDDLEAIDYNEGTVRSLTHRLRDLKIYTEHIRVPQTPTGLIQKRKCTIESVTRIKPNDHSFETEPGTRVTLLQYFRDKYGIELRLRKVPLIKIKGGTPANPKYLPIEVCRVYPNQTLPKALTTKEIQSEIVESTNTQIPLKRFEKIQNSLETISVESQALMDTFGLKISAQPIKLEGRQVPQPQLNGHRNKLNTTVPLKKSIFLNLSPHVRDVQGTFDNFFNNQHIGLIRTASGMGLSVSVPQIHNHNYNLRTSSDQMDAFGRFIKTVPKGSVQLVFVCIEDKSEVYELVKHLSENVYGILTQCIKDRLFMSTKPGYFNNFLLKTNAKLNGQNQALNDRNNEFRPRILTDSQQNTMIIGADVTHPGFHNPLANERVISSIAAVVGSYDRDFTKFMATVSAQPANTEFISDFNVMFESLLKGFQKVNRKYPQNIVLFRDGVSDSQLDSVTNEEIPQIESVYRKLKLPKPKITAYVVQKRHHTRIFLTKPEIDRNGKEMFNMKSGTIVDHTITNPDLNEFHLCSHTGRLGTSRHAKYVALRNDHNLNADQLQLLAYSMCFTYCRCLTPISIPIPVKYADLAAYRAKQHTAAQNTIFDQAPRHETDEQKRAREAHNIRELNRTMVVDENLKLIPYYC